MPTKQQIAAAYNAAIAQGLTPDAAAEAAGISDANFGDFEENDNGRISPLSISAATRSTNTPNWTSESADEDEEVEQQAATRAQGTTTSVSSIQTSTTTTSGGGSTTRVVTPTQYRDTPASTAAQQQADAAAAARDAKVAQLKAEGKSPAQIFRDPEVKALAAQRNAAQNQAADLKVPVPGTGGVTETRTPNTITTETTFTSSSPDFQTQNAGNEDQTVQLSELEQIPAATNGDVVSVTVGQEDPYEQSRLAAEADFDADQGAADTPEAVELTELERARLEAETAFNADIAVPEPVATNNPWTGVDAEKAAAWDNLSPADQEWIGNGDPTDQFILARSPDGGNPVPVTSPADVELTEEERTRLEAEEAFNEDAAAQAEREQQEAEQAAAKAAALDLARAQNTIANQRGNKNNADWRVKLRLAPLADYLYKATNPGILSPLVGTDGVLFPYTPTINTSYRANYSTVDITHSNYKGYFYQNSSVEPVTISCPFTAQSTAEAEYLLAVIHFFKSVTKMFYGQDPQRGSPPPLVYLTGLGEFQYNEHPCVVQTFTYDLPADVDYVRAYSPNVNNSNMLQQRQSNNSPTGILGQFGTIARRASAVLANGQPLPAGGMNTPPPPPTLGSNTTPTYVPTKMTINITLLPVESRQAQSERFSVRQYANGDLLKGGMW